MVPLGMAMHQGKLDFAPIMAHLPLSTFRRYVARCDGEHKVKSFSCLDQFHAMAFAQLTVRESLRDIEACLASQSHRLNHLACRMPGREAVSRRRHVPTASVCRHSSACCG